MNVQTNILLSTLTTMKIGGNANYVIEVTNRDELRQAYLNAKKLNLPVYVIGGGSNLIARDEGFAGVIILDKVPGITIVSDDYDSMTISGGGGEKWDDFVKFSVEHSLSGIEALSGIPGTVGAAPVQNIGAYGQELADNFVSLEAYDSQTDQFVMLGWDQCNFSYRHSIFRGSEAGRYAIYQITVKLYKKQLEPPFYESLQHRLDEQGITEFTPQIIRDNVLAIRADKLPDPTQLPNAGSFFKNAIVEQWQADPIKQEHPDAKTYDLGNGKVKIPAGWLIEAADMKGEELYGMKIHDKNAVVLINQSANSYADLANAREEIIDTVRNKFQITLEQEPLELQPPTPDTAA